MDFLRTLSEMYDAAGGQPVGYAAVARSLGVSRWTAYDMLRQLVRDGYASATYYVPRGEAGVGRSQVLFQPTTLAESTLRRTGTFPGDRRALQEHLLAAVRRARAARGTELEGMLGEVSRSRGPLEFCGKLVVALVIYLETHAASELDSVRTVVRLSRSLATGAPVFVGLAARTLLDKSDPVSGRLWQLIARFHDTYREIDCAGQQALSVVLDDALKAT
jgi:hypothetical protein